MEHESTELLTKWSVTFARQPRAQRSRHSIGSHVCREAVFENNIADRILSIIILTQRNFRFRIKLQCLLMKNGMLPEASSDFASTAWRT